MKNTTIRLTVAALIGVLLGATTSNPKPTSAPPSVVFEEIEHAPLPDSGEACHFEQDYRKSPQARTD